MLVLLSAALAQEASHLRTADTTLISTEVSLT